MILPLQRAVREGIADAVARCYELDPSTLPPLVIENPPTRAMGDLALPIAFELARRLRKAPRAIAAEIAGAIAPMPGIERVEAAPNGYLNVFVRRTEFLAARLGEIGELGSLQIGEAAVPAADAPKIIVEHTAINPNKAAHVGHLRNATLGDTLGRLLRFGGARVEIQNYIDDTGVQVADVVVGFRHLENLDLAQVRTVADTTRFDHYCWDLYARVTEWYEADSGRLAIRARTLHDIERGGNEHAEIGAFVADRIVRRHLETMRRLDVDYDLLTWEGDILRLQFWQRAFEILAEQRAIFLQTRGKLAGCWVMTIDGDAADDVQETPGDENAETAAGSDGDAGPESREKVIVRSDGTVTYVGKDMANQLWKLGLLGKDFHYRVFERRVDGSPLWATSSTPRQGAAREPARDETEQVPRFGRASAVYNVIDTRQSYLQELLRQALRALGHREEAERSTHFSYEMVALSPATARDLGFADADDSRAFVEVSGRKGLGVRADDLLDRLVEKARSEVAARNPDMAPDVALETAETLATAALRYFMIKFSRGKVIAFDMDEALSFEGETGPYLQYAVVRANNIFAKLDERDGLRATDLPALLAEASPAPLVDAVGADELWAIVLEASRLDEVVEQAVRSLELSTIAKYAFGLAQSFNGFYHKFQILNEPDRDAKLWRAAVADVFRARMTHALGLMGCRVPARM